MEKDLILSVREYLKLVMAFQKQGIFVADFSLGYYVSSFPETMKYEEFFIREVPKNKLQIVKELNKNISVIQKTYLLHLLGWSKDYKEIPNFLLKYIDNGNTRISNAAMRSLFPMVASGKFKPPLHLVVPLIYRRSPYVKNKSLGILAYIKNINLRKKLKKELDINYLKKLSRHKKQMVNIPATMLLKSMEDL